MTTYKTYAEAKIANPESKIYVSSMGDFATLDYVLNFSGRCRWRPCHALEYYTTVAKFINDGYKFIDGDIFEGIDGNVHIIGLDAPQTRLNEYDVDNYRRYVLRAKALETQSTKVEIDNTPQQVERLSFSTTTKRVTQCVTKVEYEQVKVKSFFELSGPFQLGELYFDVAGDCEKKSKILTELHLSQLFFRNTKIYRCIEKELTWQEHVESIYPFLEFSTKNKSVHINTKQSIDEDVYLEMCRTTLRAIGEIE